MSPIAPWPMRRGRVVAGRQQLGLDGHPRPVSPLAARRKLPDSRHSSRKALQRALLSGCPAVASGLDPPRRRPALKAMVSTFAAALLAALGLSGPSATHAAPPAGATFFVSGHGWGHGVGLAQYGAYGYALHGWAADDIVAHYYPGTDLGQAPVKRVRVLLVPGSKRVVVSSRSPFTVRDAAGKTHKLPAGKQQLGPGLKLKLAASAEGAAGAARLLARHGAARARRPRLPRHAAGDRRQGGARREHGRPRAVPLGRRAERDARHLARRGAQVAGDRGPHLRAHAHAGRRRLRRLPGHAQPGLRRHLRRVGLRRATPSTAPRARSCSTRASSPRRSSSRARAAGRRTSRTSGGSKPTPYLVSVPDPYDTLSPYHDWGPLKFSALRLGKRLGSRGTLLDVRTDAAADGRVRSLTLIGSKGNRTISGSSARAALGLRSTWFTIGTLSLTHARQAGRVRHPDPPRRARARDPARDARVAALRRPVEDARRAEVARRPGGGDALAEGDDRLPDLLGDRAQQRRAPLGRALGAADRLERPDRGHRARQAAAPRRAGAGAAPGQATAPGRPSRRRTSPPTARSRPRSTSARAAYRARVVAGKGFAAGLSPVLTVVPA